MCMVLLCLAHKLSVDGVLLLELSGHDDGFIHLVAGHYTSSLLSKISSFHFVWLLFVQFSLMEFTFHTGDVTAQFLDFGIIFQRSDMVIKLHAVEVLHFRLNALC